MDTNMTSRSVFFTLASLLIVSICALPVYAQDSADITVFDGVSQAPFALHLGSEGNWSVPVWGKETTSHKSEAIVVRLLEEAGQDIVQTQWNGGLAQVYWLQPIASDMQALTDSGAALSVVARIDQKPKKSVDLKMDCGYPCGGALNMTRLFKAVPEGQWFRMSFKLGCFEEAGANMANIFSPLVIMTKDDFGISISEVRILQNPPPESLVDCG
ncbi:MAG: putative glycoside hydrolase [Lysobacterales bacterium]|jgi:beta-glucosidase